MTQEIATFYKLLISSCIWRSEILYCKRPRLCLEELNGIYCVYQFCPPAKSKRNNTAEIAISWAMLSSHDRLNSGDGFREKKGGFPHSLLCWNQNFYVGNPMLMKTLSLAGGWCWNPFSTVPRISHTFTLFVLLSLCFLLWPYWKTPSDGADYTLYLPGSFPLFFFFFSSFPDLHCWRSSLCINIKRLIWYKRSKTLTVCFQLPCHRLIPLLCVYSGICLRKYILGWLIPPRLISAAGWWLPAALCGIFVWREIFENKFCRWYKSDC